MSVRVRHVAPADRERWIEMRAALWPEELRAGIEASADEFLSGRPGLLEAVLVAEDESGLIGFAELSRRAYAEGCSTSPVGFLEGWYVEPSRQRRGVGRALVVAAEEWALSLGCSEFASDTQYDNELGARAHERVGFEEVERLRCFRKRIGKRE